MLDLLVGLLDAGRVRSPAGTSVDARHIVVALTTSLGERRAPGAAARKHAAERPLGCAAHVRRAPAGVRASRRPRRPDRGLCRLCGARGRGCASRGRRVGDRGARPPSTGSSSRRSTRSSSRSWRTSPGTAGMRPAHARSITRPASSSPSALPRSQPTGRRCRSRSTPARRSRCGSARARDTTPRQAEPGRRG